VKNIIVISILICLSVSCKKPVSSDSNAVSEKEALNALDTVVSPEMEYIDGKLAEKIKPAIDDWLKYYALDISDFRTKQVSSLDIEKLKSDTAYSYHNYIGFTKGRNVYNPRFYDYSPDKSRYVNLLEASSVFLAEDGKYHFGGSDDNQGISLFNRKDKSAVLVSYRGYSDSADAVFWIDDRMFVIVGYAAYNDPGEFTMEVFDMEQNTKSKYILSRVRKTDKSYLMAVNMKNRNVIID
jgi:hypothetical protein